MQNQFGEFVSFLEQSLMGVSDASLDEVGVVVQVADTVCRIYGLRRVVYGELITTERGARAIVFNLSPESVAAFVLDTHIPVVERDIIRRTGTVFQIPVSNDVLGRVVDASGKAIDGLGDYDFLERRAVEVPAPGIVERSPINEPLETGIMAIDALVPIGKGQRELIVGNRNTGKTAIALQTIVHQKGKNVICLYVSIGQRQANLARIVDQLERHGAREYTVIVSADSSDAVLNQYLAPYSATTIAEYFRDQGNDVLIVYDDLSNHAVAYRAMSLLLRRPPGREAYPGDVFYLHSRLLERSGKLAKGGSITALPLVTVQEDDITAYIPTNLISITDGQLILDTQLFNSGIKPALNVGLSVSRVGGAAQTKAIKRVTGALRLELAQYHELLDFSQFGAELDAVSQKKLSRGALIVELLKQEEFVGYSFVDQVIILFLLKDNLLDAIDLRSVATYVRRFVSYVKNVYPAVYTKIATTGEFVDADAQQIRSVIHDFNVLLGQ